MREQKKETERDTENEKEGESERTLASPELEIPENIHLREMWGDVCRQHESNNMGVSTRSLSMCALLLSKLLIIYFSKLLLCETFYLIESFAIVFSRRVENFLYPCPYSYHNIFFSAGTSFKRKFNLLLIDAGAQVTLIRPHFRYKLGLEITHLAASRLMTENVLRFLKSMVF